MPALPVPPARPGDDARLEVGAAWAGSGAMALTGRADRPPLGPPSRLVPGLRALADRLATSTALGGRRVCIDPLALLGERAALAGLERAGTTSCGGATRLLRADDGWIAASLARPEDWAAVPAWLGAEATWESVAAAVAVRPAVAVIAQGVLLGLPVAALPPAPAAGSHVGLCCLDETTTSRPLDGAVVVDLTSLWAGPLCGALLAEAGARVVKVESTDRPDGARGGTPAFFDLLNAGKESVAVDLRTRQGREQLGTVLRRADVVLEAARPRALEQLGIRRDEIMEAGGPRVWLSITAHGRTGAARHRVGFGDDTAVAGGLVVADEDGPCFCADAIADPASGLTAAVAVAEALAGGGRWTLDVALASVAATLAGPTLAVDPTVVVAPPRARPPRGVARPLGADTDGVLAEWGNR